MRRLFAILLLMLVLTACAPPLMPEQIRATAVAGGCWPYGYDQPDTPVPPATVRPGTLAPTPQPTVLAYPACTPEPGKPTATVRPTSTPTPTVRPTPPPPALKGGRDELGQQPGTATIRSRQVHTPALAINGRDGRAAVAWHVWGGGPEALDGDLWVRVQSANGRWSDAQTLNRTTIRGFLGGLGITWTVSDTIVVAFGDGGLNGSTRIYTTESGDAGQTWGAPQPIGQGQISDLTSDAQGNLHAVILAPGPDTEAGIVVEGYLYYGVRLADSSTWQWRKIEAGKGYNARLAVLPLPGGGLRRFVLFNDIKAGLLFWRSDDGTNWQRLSIPLRRYFSNENPAATSLLAASRPDGSAVVAVAWSQPNGPGAVAGGVFAWVSTDGGQTWGDEERIAQHEPDGVFSAADGRGPVGGFEPSLAYDQATDQIAASWVEDDLNRRDARQISSSNRVVRTLLAARSLHDGATWRFTVTPDGAPDTPPQLTSWGQRGALWGSSDGRWQWLTVVDERNFQSRVLAQPIMLSALLVQGVP